MTLKNSIQDDGDMNQGFLLIGLNHTVLFSGETAHELIFLDLSTGSDFALPVTEEQAVMVASVASSSLQEEEAEEEQKPEPVIVRDAFKGANEAPQL